MTHPICFFPPLHEPLTFLGMRNWINVVCCSLTLPIFPQLLSASTNNGFVAYEYVSVRWAGKENTFAVLPDGRAEALRELFRAKPRPERVDERTFYMNGAMNSLGQQGFELAGFTPEEFVMKRPYGTAISTSISRPQSEAEARIAVTRVCQQGNEMRLQFFEAKLEAVHKGPTQSENIAELKRLRDTEVWLRQSLRTFTSYVLANKPFAATSEEIQQAMNDSQERVRYFNKSLDDLEAQRRAKQIEVEESSQQFEQLRAMQDHDLFLQQVLVGFSQEKARMEHSRLSSARPKNLWEQAGDTTFERLLNFAILAKLLQPQRTVVITR